MGSNWSILQSIDIVLRPQFDACGNNEHLCLWSVTNILYILADVLIFTLVVSKNTCAFFGISEYKWKLIINDVLMSVGTVAYKKHTSLCSTNSKYGNATYGNTFVQICE